jgi:hypothetical protein
MSAPLGIILHANPNQTAVDTWALVLNGVVQNTVVNTYQQMLPAAVNYDYCIDMSMSKNYTSPGFLYNAETDTFTNPNPPPPIDWKTTVRGDFNDIVGTLQTLLNDIQAGGVSASDVADAYYDCINVDNLGLDSPTLNLMIAIYNWTQEGG